MDIKGPMDMTSIGKRLYFLISVGDYSGLIVAYPMQKKIGMLSNVTKDLPNKPGTKHVNG